MAAAARTARREAENDSQMAGLPLRAKLFVFCIISSGLFVLGAELWAWQELDTIRLLAYAVLFVIASCLKVWLPSITGTMSVNHVFVLLAIQEFPLPGILAMVLAGTVAQAYWQAERTPTPVQVAFNMANMVLATTYAFRFFHSPAVMSWPGGGTTVALAGAATLYS